MDKLDKIGIYASIICAIHCALLPLIIVFLPTFFVSLFINDFVEWTFLLITFLIGIVSLCFGYNKHKSYKVFPIISIGFIILLMSKILIHNYKHNTPFYLNVIMLVGGFIIALSHHINNRLCNTCVKCKNEH